MDYQKIKKVHVVYKMQSLRRALLIFLLFPCCLLLHKNGCSGIIIKHLFDFVNNRSYGSCAACISPEILRMNSSLFFQHIIKTPV